jgi:hypothetical protein
MIDYAEAYKETLHHFYYFPQRTGGDHPLNLVATQLALNAYMLDHEEKYRDWLVEYADWSYTLPAVSTTMHRAWRPKVDGQNRQPGMPEYTGRFLDGWKNKITIWAAANPHSFLIEDDYQGEGRQILDYMRNGGLGYGIIRFNKNDESITFESWPIFGKFNGVDAHEQHPGFPRTVKMN